MKQLNKLGDLCNKIREELSKGHIENAFRELNILIKIAGSNQRDVVTLLEGSYNKSKDDHVNKLLSDEQMQNQATKTIYAILNVMREIDLQAIVTENQQKIDDIQSSLTKLSARLNFSIEIAKERISRMGECWESMFIFENKLFVIVRDFIENLLDNRLLDEELENKFKAFKLHRNLDNLYNLLSDNHLQGLLVDCILSNDDHKKLLKKMKAAYKHYNTADLVLEKNKFWLGFEIYEEARKYHDCYPIFLSEFERKNYSGCLLCLSYQKDAKTSIESAIKMFQDKYFE